MIPALTHQTWLSADLPPPLLELREALVTLHPTWQHRLYNDRDCRQLVAEAAPSLLALYDAYPLMIQRLDVWRMAAVYMHGGFYVDLDMVVKAPLDDLRSLGCVLAEDKTMDAASLEPAAGSGRWRLANYMFGARKGHPFVAAILDEMARSVRPVRSAYDVLESTGPGLVTRVFHDLAGTLASPQGVTVLRTPPGIRCCRCGTVSCQFGRYATHLHMGDWPQQIRFLQDQRN